MEKKCSFEVVSHIQGVLVVENVAIVVEILRHLLWIGRVWQISNLILQSLNHIPWIQEISIEEEEEEEEEERRMSSPIPSVPPQSPLNPLSLPPSQLPSLT
jgi:hypothetical protein